MHTLLRVLPYFSSSIGDLSNAKLKLVLHQTINTPTSSIALFELSKALKSSIESTHHVRPCTLLSTVSFGRIPAVFPVTSPPLGFRTLWQFLPIKPAVSFVVWKPVLSSAISLAYIVRARTATPIVGSMRRKAH